MQSPKEWKSKNGTNPFSSLNFDSFPIHFRIFLTFKWKNFVFCVRFDLFLYRFFFLHLLCFKTQAVKWTRRNLHFSVMSILSRRYYLSPSKSIFFRSYFANSSSVVLSYSRIGEKNVCLFLSLPLSLSSISLFHSHVRLCGGIV